MILKELRSRLSEYRIEIISENNIDDVLDLMLSNKYFYSKTQEHDVTREECLDDINALPPNVEYANKTHVAFYDKEKCIAVVDFIEGFPKDSIGYLGLLMLHESVHRKGIGEKILASIFEVAKEKGFKDIELGCYESNERGYMFWSKMGFKEIRRSEREVDGKIYTIISMQREL